MERAGRTFVQASFLFALVLLYPAPHGKAAESASAITCSELAKESQRLFEKARTKNPKEAKHWKEEIDLAGKRCKEGNDKQASGIFKEVMEEMKRELRKK
jgi:hypothetical protein